MPHPRVARACAAAALAAALAGACSDSSDTATTTTAAAGSSTTEGSGTTATTAGSTTTVAEKLIEVAFAGGQVVGGSRRESVAVGEQVRLRVTSDVADEVHVHTYDAMAEVAAGQTIELVLTASIPGRFEVELEGRRKQLLELEVK